MKPVQSSSASVYLVGPSPTFKTCPILLKADWIIKSCQFLFRHCKLSKLHFNHFFLNKNVKRLTDITRSNQQSIHLVHELIYVGLGTVPCVDDNGGYIAYKAEGGGRRVQEKGKEIAFLSLICKDAIATYESCEKNIQTKSKITDNVHLHHKNSAHFFKKSCTYFQYVLSKWWPSSYVFKECWMRHNKTMQLYRTCKQQHFLEKLWQFEITYFKIRNGKNFLMCINSSQNASRYLCSCYYLNESTAL